MSKRKSCSKCQNRGFYRCDCGCDEIKKCNDCGNISHHNNYNSNCRIGFPGPQGNNGATGLIGATGLSVNGNNGATGINATDGATGPCCPGTSGLIGDIGLKGIQGVIGPGTGMQGEEGITGDQGFSGLIGSTGIGNTGATGFIGTSGLTGASGICCSGATGFTGMIGTQGNQGFTGPTAIISNSGTTGMNSIGSTGMSGSDGFTGIIGSTGINGSSGLVGSSGLFGPTGICCPGSTGLTGLMESEGTTGIDGSTGSQGNVGNTGVTGNTGIIGVIGLAGIIGDNGITGLNGNTGINGSMGINGNSGINGITGLVGFTGFSGNTGIIGNTGLNGSTGFMGSTGFIGATGYQGSTGLTNATGIPGIIGLIGPTGICCQGATGITGNTGVFVLGIFGSAYNNFSNAQLLTGSTGLPATSSQFVTFNATGINNGIVMNNSNNALILPNTGDYEADFTVTFATPFIGFNIFSLVLNSSTYLLNSGFTTYGNGIVNIQGNVQFSASANDQISLANSGGQSVMLVSDNVATIVSHTINIGSGLTLTSLINPPFNGTTNSIYVIVFNTYIGGPPNNITVTDSLNRTYTLAGFGIGGLATESAIFYLDNAVSLIDFTVTVTFSIGALTSAIEVIEIINTSVPTSFISFHTQSGVGSPITLSLIPSSSNQLLLLGAINIGSSSGIFTSGTATVLDSIPNYQYPIVSAYNYSTSAGVTNLTVNYLDTVRYYRAVGVVIGTANLPISLPQVNNASLLIEYLN